MNDEWVVRELPCLMSSEMVRKTLAGTKTMTRRPMKPQPVCTLGVQLHTLPVSSVVMWHRWPHRVTLKRGPVALRNPLGADGDLLYVRETCRAEELPDGLDGIRYLADDAFVEIEDSPEAGERWSALYHYRHGEGLTVPAVHMPKWAARLWLMVTDARVEQGPAISEADARAEGFEDAAAFMAWWAQHYPGQDWRWVTSYEVMKR